MSSLVRWTAVLALGLSSCQRTGPATDVPEPEPSQAKADPGAQPGDSPGPDEPIAEPTHPLELVPSRARIMLMARSPLRLAEAWERERLAGAHPIQYGQLVEEMKRNLGLDLLDPADLSRLGIDPSAPAGFAVLSVRDEAFVVFGGLRDASVLIETVEGLAGRPVPRESLGNAELYRVDQELTLVIRNGMLAVVFVDRVRPESPDYPREVARIDPARSLAHAPAMQRAHAGLPDDVDLRGLLDPAGLLRDELDRERQRDQESLADANRRLAEARQRGAQPEEIDSLQQMLQDEQRFIARRRRERQIAELLVSRTIGSVEGIGLAVDASDRGLLGRIHIALTSDSAFRSLLVDDDEPPHALTSLDDDPQLVLSGHLDVGTTIELVSQMALAAGGSYAEINDEIRDELGFDFDRELRSRLDGRVTFALTAREPKAIRGPQDVAELMGGVLAVGVTDEAAVREALDRAVAKLPRVRVEPAPEIGGHRIDLPDDDDPFRVWAGVVGGQLAVGTDLAAMRRLRDGSVGSAGSRWPDPEAWPRLTTGTAAARLAMHHRMPIFLMFGFMESFDSFDFLRDVDFELSAEFPDQDLGAISRGKAVRRLETKRDKAHQAYRELKDQRRAEKLMKVWRHAEKLGLTAGTGRMLDTGLLLEGGHYARGGMGTYVETLMGFDEIDDGETSVDGRLEQARRKVDEVQSRLTDARRKEILRHLAKNPPS